MLPGTDPRIASLEVELTRVRNELERVLATVPEDKLHRAPPGRWTPAQIVWHLAKVERGVARMIERFDGQIPATATVPPGPAPSKILTIIDQFPWKDRIKKLEAPEAIRPPGEIDYIAERARLADGRAQLFGAIRAAGPRLTLMRHDHPYFGSFDGWQWTMMIARHEERHMLQLHEVLAETA